MDLKENWNQPEVIEKQIKTEQNFQLNSKIKLRQQEEEKEGEGEYIYKQTKCRAPITKGAS